MIIDLGKIAVTPKGEFVNGVSYENLDIVTSGGSSYVSLVQNNTQPLSNNIAWQLIAEKGADGAKGDTGYKTIGGEPINPTDTAPATVQFYKPTLSNEVGLPYPNLIPAEDSLGNTTVLTAKDGYDTLFYFDGVKWTKSETLLPSVVVSPEFDVTTETEAQGGKQIYDFILENKIGGWANVAMVQGAYIIEDVVTQFAGYDYIKLTEVSDILKLSLSGRTRASSEPTIKVCYGKLISGGFETIYDTPNIDIVDLEVDIQPNKYSAIYVNLRNSSPTRVDFYKEEKKIYASEEWVENNKKSVITESILPLYQYSLLSDGSYADLGAEYKHSDDVRFKIGDVFDIEYGTNATLYYLFLFDENHNFVESLWQENTADGGRKIKTFTPTFNGQFRLNSNFPNTLGLPKIKKTSQEIRFLTPDYLGINENLYEIDAYYLETDLGDYGITLNRIISLMSSKGGVINFSIKDYNIATQVVINKPVFLSGMGGSEFYQRSWFTRIFTSSPTLKMFQVIGGGIYFIAKGIYFHNVNTLPTAGRAISVESGTPIIDIDGNQEIEKLVAGLLIADCTFSGFYDNVFLSGACQFTISNCLINYAVRYNLYVDADTWRDAGDSSIIGCNFLGLALPANRVTEAHIYQKGSGGLKISTCKFNNQANYSILGEIAGDTVILNISNCSFENHNISAIKYSKTSNVFRHINISNCEFDSYKIGTTDIDIRSGIQDVNIIGNSFSSGMTDASNTAINLNAVDSVRLMNTYRGYTNPLNIYNSTNVKEATLQDPVATNINK